MFAQCNEIQTTNCASIGKKGKHAYKHRIAVRAIQDAAKHLHTSPATSSNTARRRLPAVFLAPTEALSMQVCPNLFTLMLQTAQLSRMQACVYSFTYSVTQSPLRTAPLVTYSKLTCWPDLDCAQRWLVQVSCPRLSCVHSSSSNSGWSTGKRSKRCSPQTAHPVPARPTVRMRHC